MKSPEDRLAALEVALNLHDARKTESAHSYEAARNWMSRREELLDQHAKAAFDVDMRRKGLAAT